jgi:hypothetical protein
MFKSIKLNKEQLQEFITTANKRGHGDDRHFMALCTIPTMIRYYLKTTDWSFKAGCNNVKEEFKRSLGFSPLMVLAIIVTVLVPLIKTVDCFFKIIRLLRNRNYILKYKVTTSYGVSQVKTACELYRKYKK